MLSKLKSLIERSGPPKTAKVRQRVAIDDKVAVIYAIPDIHGCYDELLHAEDRIFQDAAGEAEGLRQIVYLGDYVDRGPRSADVIQHLMSSSHHGFERICLCGNHDDVMCQFMLDPAREVDWLENGGAETLISYGVNVAGILRKGGVKQVRAEALIAIPSAHLEWLAALPIMAARRNIVFAHAGLRLGVPLEHQSEEDLMWIREPFLSRGPDEGLFVVHGHTIAREVEFKRNRVGLDTGAYLTGKLQVLKISRSGMTLV